MSERAFQIRAEHYHYYYYYYYYFGAAVRDCLFVVRRKDLLRRLAGAVELRAACLEGACARRASC